MMILIGTPNLETEKSTTEGDEEIMDALIKYYETECSEDTRLKRDQAHSMKFFDEHQIF